MMETRLHRPAPNVCEHCEVDLLLHGYAFWNTETGEHYDPWKMIVVHQGKEDEESWERVMRDFA